MWPNHVPERLCQFILQWWCLRSQRNTAFNESIHCFLRCRSHWFGKPASSVQRTSCLFPPTPSFPKALHLSGGMPASGLDWQNSASFSRLDFKLHKSMAGLSLARDFFSFDPGQGFPVVTHLPAEWYCLLALCPDTFSLLCLVFTVISLYSSKTSQKPAFIPDTGNLLAL